MGNTANHICRMLHWYALL